MPMVYKFNVLAALKKKGYSSTRLRNEKILSESTMQKFRRNEMVTTNNIARLCKIFNCQPGDIIEYIPDED